MKNVSNVSSFTTWIGQGKIKLKGKMLYSNCTCLCSPFIRLISVIDGFHLWYNQLYRFLKSHVCTYCALQCFQRFIIIITEYLLRTHWAEKIVIGMWLRENLFLVKSFCFHHILRIITYLRQMEFYTQICYLIW